MNVRNLPLACLGAVALALAGCGGQAGSSSPPTSTPPPSIAWPSPQSESAEPTPESEPKHPFASFQDRAQQVQDDLAPCATLKGEACPEELGAMVALAQEIGEYAETHGYFEVAAQVSTILDNERSYVDIGCAQGSTRPACAPAGSSLRLGWMTLKTVMDTACVTETGSTEVCTLVEP